MGWADTNTDNDQMKMKILDILPRKTKLNEMSVKIVNMETGRYLSTI